jgi:hypothetical protein
MLAGAGVLGLAGTAPAGAAVQIGETFAPTGGCATDATGLQSGSPNQQYAAPSAGVITSWSHRAPASPAPLKLKIGRPGGGDVFTIVGESGFETPAPNSLNTFGTQIPVQAGDVIGLYFAPGAMTVACHRPAGGYANHYLPGDQPPGTTASFIPESGTQFDLSAVLEPDCDSDGLGDETQDPSLLGGDCSVRGRTVTLDANKNKVKKGKKVTLTGRLTEIVRQGECQSGQTVQLQRKRPTQTTFTTIEQLQTDAAGSFSTKKKVKKTFEYRAQVAETATCAGQTSNSEKVKVKRKK